MAAGPYIGDPAMHLDSPCSIRYHFTAPWFIFVRARTLARDPHRTRIKRSPLDVGRWIERWPEDRWKKKGKIAVFTSGRSLVTLRKSRQSRTVATLRMAERSAGCVARYSGTDCARHFHTFYVNREIWRTDDCAREIGGKKRDWNNTYKWIYARIGRRSLTTRLSSSRSLISMMVQFNDDLSANSGVNVRYGR